MISLTMASMTASRYMTSIFRAPKIVSPLLRPYPRLPRTLQPVAHRFAHTIPRPTKPTQNASSSSPETSSEPSSEASSEPISRKVLEPHYQLTFTCVPCTERSSHTVSKQGYHKGSVLITCPSCRNRHIISDNLNIFGDRKITVEDLLREKGQLVKRGTLGEEGDIEFWEDTPNDTVDVGEASGESVQEEAARRLRGTRDPSSQTTDSTPSASVLPGNTGNRSPVHGITYQSPLPSTRRQFHTKRFKPPINIQQRGVQPMDRTKETGKENRDDASFDSEVHAPSDSHTDGRVTSRTIQDIALFEKLRYHSSKITHSPPKPTSFVRVRHVKGSESKVMDEPMVRKVISEIHYNGPRFVRVRHVKGSERKVMDEPMVRKVISEIHYNGPRFVPSDHHGPIAVQLQPGVVLRRRPRNGVVVKEPIIEAPEAPKAPKRRGLFRPSFLPLLPNSPPSQI